MSCGVQHVIVQTVVAGVAEPPNFRGFGSFFFASGAGFMGGSNFRSGSDSRGGSGSDLKIGHKIIYGSTAPAPT